MLNTVLFDLDGTLLFMSQDAFIERYLKLLAQKAAEYGFEPKTIIDALWQGTYAMIKNDGAATNHNRFWHKFTEILGNDILTYEPMFNQFYVQEFDQARAVTTENPLAKEAIDLLKAKGYTVALATNPLFPPVAQRTRLSWIGLKPEDFAYLTHYENSHYCKPNPNYFREVLKVLGKQPGECLMVGNNVVEDMCAKELGMQVYLVNNYIENDNEEARAQLPQGSFAELMEYLRVLPDLS